MKKTLIVSAIVITTGMVSLSFVWSDSDFRREIMAEYEHNSKGIKVIPNPDYAEECGSCHMAYPPGLLPASSWSKLMSGLEEHFGDNAEVDTGTQRVITDYLLTNNATTSDYRHSRKFSRGITNENTPIRISNTSYFIHEHDEIPARMVAGNPEVKSFSHCNACHVRAEQGSFNEHDIRIPRYGRWDD